MKVEIFKGKKGQFYYHIKSRNGRILCVSEGYTLEKDAYRAARNLIKDVKKKVILIERQDRGLSEYIY